MISPTNFLYLSTINNYDLFNSNLPPPPVQLEVDSLQLEADSSIAITELFPDADLPLTVLDVTSPVSELSSTTSTLSSSISVSSSESVSSPKSITNSSESVSSSSASSSPKNIQRERTSNEIKKERNRIAAQNYRNKKKAFEENLIAKSAVLDHIVAMVNCQIESSKAIDLTTMEGTSMSKAQIIMKLFKESLKK